MPGCNATGGNPEQDPMEITHMGGKKASMKVPIVMKAVGKKKGKKGSRKSTRKHRKGIMKTTGGKFSLGIRSTIDRIKKFFTRKNK